MEQDLFNQGIRENIGLTPLPDRIRPTSLDEIAGQKHLIGKGCFLRNAVEADQIPSLILWGPPGVGKTTLAKVIAVHTKAVFISYSAIGGSVKDIRSIIEKAGVTRRDLRKRTILFIDEIHRFNKAQQDTLLPGVEQGIVTLIGATTENPSFQIVSALLSRCKVLELNHLEEDDIIEILKRAAGDNKRGLGPLEIEADDEVFNLIAASSKGDGRYALSALDLLFKGAEQKGLKKVSVKDAEEISSSKALLYDKGGDEHYNIISAFIKSMRGSDPDGALYWMFRMLDAGEDPLFILRRMIIFASEDIGNADPRALQLAMSADAAFQRLGMPEGAYPLAQACTYLSSAPKSNAQVEAIKGPRNDIRQFGPLGVPKKLRNAPTKMMKDLGFSEGYRYPHSEGGYAKGETYLPDKLIGRRYYKPVNSGLEERIAIRLKDLRNNN